MQGVFKIFHWKISQKYGVFGVVPVSMWINRVESPPNWGLSGRLRPPIWLFLVYFSLYVERKVPKERHPRKGPTSLPWETIPLFCAHILLSAKCVDRAHRSQFDGYPHGRRSASHAELARFLCRQAGCLTEGGLALRSRLKAGFNHGRASALG